MSPRSVIASLLLGMHPPVLSGARVVQWCGLFDISENAARVAMSRMVERGELRAGAGRYELVGAVRTRQGEHDWVLEGVPPPWDGAWLLAIGPAGARPAAERAEFRGAAQHARLVEMRPGVWCRPDNLPPAATPTEVWSVVVGSATVWTATPPANAVPDLVARFRLDDWAVRARELIDGLARSTQPLSTTTDAIPPAFAAGAAALQHLRRDPILPVALLPVDWPGDALRAAYRAYQPAFGAAVAAFFAS